MIFNPDEIYQIAATIFETAVSLQLEAELPAWAGNHPRCLLACIQITGAWNGAILLDCPVEVARLAASSMFNSEPANLAVADLQDALAELVNMMGGNFKALLPETCYLSLPAVVEGGDYSTRLPGSAVLGRVAFGCQGYPLSIVLLEKVQAVAA